MKKTKGKISLNLLTKYSKMRIFETLENWWKQITYQAKLVKNASLSTALAGKRKPKSFRIKNCEFSCRNAKLRDLLVIF